MNDAKRWIIWSLLLLFAFSSTSAQATTYYFHNDHLGTPQVLTDDTQTVVWQGEYDPFGKATETVSDVKQNLPFPGQYLDRETGLHYNYHRTYDPTIGRYTQSDPIGLGGGINTYGYAYQNPLRYTDPNGLSPAAGCLAGSFVGPIGCGVGTVIMGGVSLALILSLNGDSVDSADEQTCSIEGNDDGNEERCNKATQDAQRIYNDLVTKRIPQYLSDVRMGKADDGHFKAISTRQSGLRDAVRRVSLYCNPLPAEYQKWLRLANQNFPRRH